MIRPAGTRSTERARAGPVSPVARLGLGLRSASRSPRFLTDLVTGGSIKDYELAA